MISSPTTSRFLLVGGKSVGHLAPLVAVWRELHEKHSQTEALFCCTDTPSDATFLAREDVPFTVMRQAPMRWMIPLWLPVAMAESWMLLRRTKPVAILSKGGLVSVPVVLMGRLLGIPVLLHESDVVSGRATKLLANVATILCRGLPFDHNKEGAVWKRAILTGNPVRKNLLMGERERGKEITGLRGEKPVLLVTGGSQGAVALNTAIANQIDELLKMVDVIHLTGRGKEESIVREGYFSLPFATTELSHLYALADLALSRAGAGAVSELALFGIPTILVPLEGVAQDHQLKNAETLQRLGACVLLRQSELNAKLLSTVRTLMSDEKLRSSLTQHLQQVSAPEAAGHIAEMLLKYVDEYRKSKN